MLVLRFILYCFGLVLITSSCNTSSKLFHQVSQANSPVIFADTIRTTNGISFSENLKKLYVSEWVNETEKNGRRGVKIFEYDYNNGKYHNNQIATFCRGLSDYHPVADHWRSRIFFNSRRPVPGSDTLNSKVHIWFVEKTKSGWSEARYPAEINAANYHNSYPTVSKRGNLYFNSDRPGSVGGMDIYFSEYRDGKFMQPVNLTALNTPDAENDLVIDPDERFIIFNRGYANRSMHMFICFRTDTGWGKPRKLEIINEDDVWELTPTLSPDGKYFLYERRGMIMGISLFKLLTEDEKNLLNLKRP